ncbi:hypothetical protein O0L34_g7710 [Tuta absoluta]|nr:hypothetical protein O0L34_g7710 [Tuta absoluta]
MKLIVACVLALAAFAAARPSDEYTDKYDNVNVEEIINNKRLLGPYIKCVLEQGNCTPEGKELKSHIKEALETYCEKCTDTQKQKTKVVLGHLINKEPQYWHQLQQKYDSDNKYTKKYEDELKTLKA